MRTFLAFEAVVLLLCLLLVFILAGSSSSPLPSGTQIDASPDEHLALYWLRRTVTQPYRNWYLHDTEAYDTVALDGRLAHDIVAQGGVVFPLHALYLRLCGQLLRWTMPDRADDFFEETRRGDLDVAKMRRGLPAARHTSATLGAACVVLLGAPGCWALVRALTRLLARAAQERERVARVALPCSDADAQASTAAAVPLNETQSSTATPHAANRKTNDPRDLPPTSSVATTHNVNAAAMFSGSLLLVIVGLLPLLIMEVCTLQPWCLAGGLLVWAVAAVLQDECGVHAGEAETTDDAFDLAAPIFEEGAVVFFALKTQPSVAPLVAYTVAATLLSLTMSSCLCATPVLFLWALTSCWQHGYKRVLVKLKSPAGLGDVEADRDGYVRVGYSCYVDKLHMNACFCRAFMASVLVVLCITTPWWWQRQPLLSFMDLFAGSPAPVFGAEATDSATSAAGQRSFTGALEMHAHCLHGFPQQHDCALPTANVWRLSEWFGVPWTRASKALTRAFIDEDTYVNGESTRWLQFATVMLAVLANASSVLVLTFYRIRKPPLAFETPVRYAAERAAHQADQQAYWKEKQRARRGGPPRPPQSATTSSTTANNAASEQKRAKVVTCLCREEYLVKQLVLLCWMLALATTSGTLLFLHRSPASGVLTVTCSALLASVYAVVRVLRAAYPLAFYAAPSTQPEAVGGVEKDDSSTLTQQDRDNPRPPPASRWCTTSVAPSLAHVADAAWVQLMVAATVLSTGALSWTAVSALQRHVALVVLAGSAAISLWRLRRWAAVDGTSWVLVVLGGVTSLLLLGPLLLAQSMPVSMRPADHAGIVELWLRRLGSAHASSGDAALHAFIGQCAVAAVLYVVCAAHATLRIGRLTLEPEEMRLVPMEAEMNFFAKPSQAKKRQ